MIACGYLLSSTPHLDQMLGGGQHLAGSEFAPCALDDSTILIPRWAIFSEEQSMYVLGCMLRFAKNVDTMHDINTLPMHMVSEICESITGIRHILG